MTEARRAQAVQFMDAFMDGPLVPPEMLRPSEGTLRECGSDPRVAWMEHHSLADVMASVPAEMRRQVMDMARVHQPLHINNDLSMTITNTVHSTLLINTVTRQPYRLPLNHLMLNLMFMAPQTNTMRFAKIVQRYGPVFRLTHLMFTTGNVVETGPVSFEVKRQLIFMLVEMMRALGLPNVGIGRRVCQNIVSAGMLRFPVRLWVLRARYEQRVTYEPDLFPGATIRDPALQTLLIKSDKVDHDHIDDLADALAAMHDPTTPFQTVDIVSDERLDDPDAMRAANEYALTYLARMSAEGIEAPEIDAGRADPSVNPMAYDRFTDLVDEQMSKQKKKNIVGLIFGNGCFISGGSKNVRMQRRACAIMYDMLVHCQDTPENRALEEAYLKRMNIKTPAHTGAPIPKTSTDGSVVVSMKKRGRPPGTPGLNKVSKKTRKE
jgi:TATA-box binding protein (TBP) (component of TFIID and TFIIIB)